MNNNNETKDPKDEKNYQDKICLANDINLDIINISQAKRMGLTGDPETQNLIDDVSLITDSELEAQLDKIKESLYSLTRGVSSPVLYVPQPETAYPGLRIDMSKNNQSRHNGFNNHNESKGIFSNMSRKDLIDLYLTYHSKNTMSQDGKLIISAEQFHHWAHTRWNSKRKQAIIKSPKIADMLLSHQKAIDKGSMSLYQPEGDEDE